MVSGLIGFDSDKCQLGFVVLIFQLGDRAFGNHFGVEVLLQSGVIMFSALDQ